MLTLVKLHSGYYYSQQDKFEYSQTLEFALENKHEYCFILSSPLAVKRDIAVTILLRCMCMHVSGGACVRPDLSGT